MAVRTRSTSASAVSSAVVACVSVAPRPRVGWGRRRACGPAGGGEPRGAAPDLLPLTPEVGPIARWWGSRTLLDAIDLCEEESTLNVALTGGSGCRQECPSIV
jgi:hypothetical protein